MEGAPVLELYELRYSDLVLLSSNGAVSQPLPEEEIARLGTVKRSVMETLGPSGPGLLSVTGLPNDATLLRRDLLLLSRRLALLPREHRNRVLKEHNLGGDVPLKNPDRNVSSFAMQLQYADLIPESASGCVVDGEKGIVDDDDFRGLGEWFTALGYWMMELGLGLAQLCDDAIGGHELEQGLLESGTAKGRLIHYHSRLDKFVVRESSGRKGARKPGKEQKHKEGDKLIVNGNGVGLNGNDSELWQQWHYDYGIFTVLTVPMFIMSHDLDRDMRTVDQGYVSRDQECTYPDGHTYLRIFYPSKNNVFMVKASPESFIVQVGESADVLSKGKLRATLHCVCRPLKLDNVSRETFVVFLQPAWSKTFSVSHYLLECCLSAGDLSCEGDNSTENDLNVFSREIQKIVPPLSSRLKDGMTFAEFSRETTKQYYGGSGLQFNS